MRKEAEAICVHMGTREQRVFLGWQEEVQEQGVWNKIVLIWGLLCEQSQSLTTGRTWLQRWAS